MRDARDAEDALLLQSGDHAGLIAAYHDVVVQRCRIAVRSEAGYDVAQNVFERLLKELGRGKRYTVPYRVVVHKVVDWTIKEHFQDLPDEVPLPNDWESVDERRPYLSPEDKQLLEELFAKLPPVERRVFTLAYMLGLTIDDTAQQLGMTRNAVDQALHRGHAKLAGDVVRG